MAFFATLLSVIRSSVSPSFHSVAIKIKCSSISLENPHPLSLLGTAFWKSTSTKLALSPHQVSQNISPIGVCHLWRAEVLTDLLFLSHLFWYYRLLERSGNNLPFPRPASNSRGTSQVVLLDETLSYWVTVWLIKQFKAFGTNIYQDIVKADSPLYFGA